MQRRAALKAVCALMACMLLQLRPTTFNGRATYTAQIIAGRPNCGNTFLSVQACGRSGMADLYSFDDGTGKPSPARAGGQADAPSPHRCMSQAINGGPSRPARTCADFFCSGPQPAASVSRG